MFEFIFISLGILIMYLFFIILFKNKKFKDKINKKYKYSSDPYLEESSTNFSDGGD